MPDLQKGPYYIGIDIGGTNIALGIVDQGGEILTKHSIPTGAGRPFGTIVKEMAETARATAEKAGFSADQIAGVGIGVPSTVDPRTKRVVFANNLDWRDLDLIGEFRKTWDTAIYMENDADCAALGEAVAGYDYKTVFFVTLGTGFGGGFILNGRLFKGGDHFGIEPGHSVLIQSGVQCTCGNYGCLESYASVTALIRQTKEKMKARPESLMWKVCGKDLERVDSRTSFDAARAGDEAAREVVDEFIGYVASGIASLITLFRPEAVIVGGGLCNEGDYLMKPLYELTSRRIYAPDLMPMPPLLKARLGNDAGIIGAALLGKAPS
jgi:glucokinase